MAVVHLRNGANEQRREFGGNFFFAHHKPLYFSFKGTPHVWTPMTMIQSSSASLPPHASTLNITAVVSTGGVTRTCFLLQMTTTAMSWKHQQCCA